MIIEKQQDVTTAVLAEMHRTPDPRTKEILESLVRHLHGFVREVKLTEREFDQAVGLINAIGQKTSASHNEAVLIAGALGVSNLVCLLNNGANGTRETRSGARIRRARPMAARCCARPRRDRRCFSRAGCVTPRASRSPAPMSMSGIRPPSACTKTRTPPRPR